MKDNLLPRYFVIAALFGLMAAAIVGKLIQIQVFPQKEALAAQNEGGKYAYRIAQPSRGQIYDRWGHLLAGNEEVYEVGVDLLTMKNPETVALLASTLLGRDYNEVVQALTFDEDNPPGRYYVLARYVPRETKEKVERYIESLSGASAPATSFNGEPHSLAGVSIQPHQARLYPEKALASNVLGFVSRDNIGYFGIEAYYNQMLAGVVRPEWIPLDPHMAADIPGPVEGASLVLTIDREIQSSVEEILDQAIHESGAEAGTILVMDPETGEILAMASFPRIDLNEYWQIDEYFDAGQPFNMAVTDYEPGSVFKVLTMAAALDSDTVEPETVFLDTGAFYVDGVTIHNWDWGAWGEQDMTGCMQHSLNVCLAWVATEMGSGTFYDYMRNFGLGHLTGIDLDDEVTGRLRLPGDALWFSGNLAINAFGQGVSATPVQMVMAISAVANDGKMMVPHVVKAVVEDGRQYDVSPRVAGTPISAETAHTLTHMLAVSLEEEASSALIEGYRVAGKTGTAEIAGPDGYTSELTNASFVGWGPADDPKFLVYVWLKKPTSSPWGSVVAAPVFSQVVTRLVILMDIPPDDVRQAIVIP